MSHRTLPLALLLGACVGDYAAHGDIEATYLQTGPYDVTYVGEFACCDRDDSEFVAWLPGGDAARPVLVWGNGTAAGTDNYLTLLEHFASWGFAVVAPENPGVGDGVPLVEALDAAAAANAEADSPLFGRLDLGRVGAAGHSQGAGGATNLMRADNERVTALVTFSRPHAQWCTEDALCPHPTELERGATFYVTGGRDVILAPPSAQRAVYNHTPDEIRKVRATLRGARHTDPEGDPGCEDVPFCARGAEGFLGYPTAWLAANLGVDGGALAAFGPEGELSEATEDWSDVRTNVEVP